MKTPSVIDQITFLMAVHRMETGAKRELRRAARSAMKAFEARDCLETRQWFELALAWREIHRFLLRCKEDAGNHAQPLYVVDAWFLQDLLVHLTRGADEEISYVTGPCLGRLRILSRIRSVELEHQSAVHALAKASSCADVLATILEKGNRLHVMAHSHPGQGAAATCPSSIDTRYLGRIQRAGAEVVGIIVTRDGFVRFFSVVQPLAVLVQGAGVQQVEEYVYQIEPPSQDCDPQVATA